MRQAFSLGAAPHISIKLCRAFKSIYNHYLSLDHPSSMNKELAIRQFFLLISKSSQTDCDEDLVIRAMRTLISVVGIPPHILNEGLYLAAKVKFFQCVGFLVQEKGALFEENALDKLFNEEDGHYTVKDMVEVVRAAYHQGHPFLGGLRWEYALRTLVYHSRTRSEEQDVIQVLPMIIPSPETVADNELGLRALDVTLYHAALNKLFDCVTHLAGEYSARFYDDALLNLLNAHPNFTFEDAMVVKDAVAGCCGLNPNATDEDGNTILHIYCARVRTDARVKVDIGIVKAMVVWGVNPRIRNNHGTRGETAYIVLVKWGEPGSTRQFSETENTEMIEIIKYLLHAPDDGGRPQQSIDMQQ